LKNETLSHRGRTVAIPYEPEKEFSINYVVNEQMYSVPALLTHEECQVRDDDRDIHISDL